MSARAAAAAAAAWRRCGGGATAMLRRRGGGGGGAIFVLVLVAFSYYVLVTSQCLRRAFFLEELVVRFLIHCLGRHRPPRAAAALRRRGGGGGDAAAVATRPRLRRASARSCQRQRVRLGTRGVFSAASLRFRKYSVITFQCLRRVLFSEIFSSNGFTHFLAHPLKLPAAVSEGGRQVRLQCVFAAFSDSNLVS